MGPLKFEIVRPIMKKNMKRERKKKTTQLFKRRLTNIFVESNVSIFH